MGRAGEDEPRQSVRVWRERGWGRRTGELCVHKEISKGALQTEDWHSDRPSTRLQCDTPTRGRQQTTRDKGNTRESTAETANTNLSSQLHCPSARRRRTHLPLTWHPVVSHTTHTHTHSSSRLLQQSQYEDLSSLYPLPSDGCTVQAAATGITLVTRELSTSSLSLTHNYASY